MHWYLLFSTGLPTLSLPCLTIAQYFSNLSLSNVKYLALANCYFRWGKNEVEGKDTLPSSGGLFKLQPFSAHRVNMGTRLFSDIA